jgi:hypothetical protein
VDNFLGGTILSKHHRTSRNLSPAAYNMDIYTHDVEKKVLLAEIKYYLTTSMAGKFANDMVKVLQYGVVKVC